MSVLTEDALNRLNCRKVSEVLSNLDYYIFKAENCVHSRANRQGETPRQIIQRIGGFDNQSYTGRVMTQKSRNYLEDGKQLIRALRDEYDLVIFEDFSCSRRNTEPKSALLRLAGKLALNLVDVSTPTDQYENVPYNNILRTDDLASRRIGAKHIERERFVVVVGADASTAATSGSKPLADQEESAEYLREKFEGVKPELIDKKITSIRKQSNAMDLNNFEATVQALCDFNRDMVIQGLEELCGYKHTPSLSYEIIAHLLKHRFVDVVVNFNNDELLDNAIEEELPDSDDYRYIYTAGHCPQNVKDLYIDYRLRKPMYVKCHGTISHPNSLRLRGRKAFVTEPAIQQHLTDTLIGKLEKENNSDDEELPLNLIIIGFSMDNIAFNRVLQTVLNNKEKPITVWLFDFDGGETEGKVSKRISKLLRASEKRPSVKVERIPVGKGGRLDDQLSKLWEVTSQCFSEPYVPQGIARHQLVNHVFKNYSPVTLKANLKRRLNYLNDRLYLELAIMMLQTDGFIHLSRVGKNRAGKFYQLLRALTNDHVHIGEHLRNMGMSKYRSFMHDTYYIHPEKKVQSKDEILDHVIKHLRSNKTLTNKTFLAHPGSRNLFIKYAKAIQEKRLGMINPKYVDIHGNRFTEVTTKDVMNTSLAWVYKYRSFLSEEGLKTWDVMLTVTEKGRFLYHDLRETVSTDFSNKKFAVVLARFDCDAPMTDYTKSLKSRLRMLGDGLRFRSWWTHNQHMVIFLKRRDNFPSDPEKHNWRKDWHRVGGFYYTSRMLSRRISPVRLESYDLFKAMIDFAIYYKGSAVAFTEERYDPIVTEKDVDKTLNELLWSYVDE